MSNILATKLLALETSCDETAAAVLDVGSIFRAGEFQLLSDVISSQIKLHEPYGGVVPELAAREHIRNLPFVVGDALSQAKVGVQDLCAVAVTGGPGLKGCLLSGLSFGQALAYSRKVPFLVINHLEAHLFAGDLLEKEKRPRFPMLVLLVSGGHTQLVFIESFRHYEVLAGTRDDAAGEAFDKIATILGLPYPGGPALSLQARSGHSKRFSLPRALRDDPRSFSFSGLKTAVVRLVEQSSGELRDAQLVNDLCASAESAIVDALAEKTRYWCRERMPQSVVLTGGVAANEPLQRRLDHEVSACGATFVVPSSRWCTDNAAMIGSLAVRVMASAPEKYRAGIENGGAWHTGNAFHLEARARWPVSELNR